VTAKRGADLECKECNEEAKRRVTFVQLNSAMRVQGKCKQRECKQRGSARVQHWASKRARQEGKGKYRVQESKECKECKHEGLCRQGSARMQGGRRRYVGLQIEEVQQKKKGK
jgi:hypothetical protein